MEKDIEKGKSKEVKLTIYQILNELRVSGRLRKVAETKFMNDTYTKSEWVKLFKNNRFDF